MKKNKIFEDLIILDIANNHFGNVNHAIKIISDFNKIIKDNKINSAFKFQFRDLDTFIHKDFQKSDQKYVKRFLSTRLEINQFKKILKFIKKKKNKSACTPFDERSVDHIEKMGFDFLKIASVSAMDFNIHERVVENKIPKIISTGGLKIEEIDKIVSFYTKKNQTFCIMHCVSIYPTKNEDLHISFIKNLKLRYRNIPIGWSTHEDPKENSPAALAYACGASVFEKHIGVKSKKYKLNNYSSTPESFRDWVANFNKCKRILGDEQKVINKEEITTLNLLQRGVYLKKNIKKNELLKKNSIYFAFPLQKGQLSSTKYKETHRAKKNLEKNKALKLNDVITDKNKDQEELIYSYLHKLKAILNYNSIGISKNFTLEISHHKGIKNFERVGCYLFNIINEEYAKKILVMLPNQSHPSHHHKIKKETFIILQGDLVLKYKNKNYRLDKGDVFHLNKNSWHKFKSGKQGCIFEEISTTSHSDDSYYQNTRINTLQRNERKTYINNWFSLYNKVN